ncbi:2Fe-2S iron-sulfur cluster-binding protein [Metabacillus sediminilitoris]|uniref:(2Fe-2S)-binding protein n=1 Tax=Metabacillus sediminilitoris TaxID=2567941 RepID=A0A4S4C5N9_9BACI|nr:2Fe-2S iron-sulfur cluster-binding protein [Metabacillus sediminilitoris]QGQ45152.1 2Fe-2S iron-sulfur cluster binding domain-containing protein [Metabacillus sediminilitoris]THF82549.1 (2Fe-2S)-binding protein [Metabacillus sediminilitoris]
MAYVTVLGYGTFEVENGKKLVLALEDNGVNILHRCGGKARCTTCRVEVLAGDFCDLTNIEKNAFMEKGIDDHLRLSCQIRVNGNTTIRPIMTVESSNLDVGPRPVD